MSNRSLAKTTFWAVMIFIGFITIYVTAASQVRADAKSPLQSTLVSGVWIREQHAANRSPEGSFAGSPLFRYRGESYRRWGSIQFDMGSLPGDAIVHSANLQLHLDGDLGDARIPVLLIPQHDVFSTELSGRRNQHRTMQEDHGIAPAIMTSGWNHWDVTGLVNGWRDDARDDQMFSLLVPSDLTATQRQEIVPGGSQPMLQINTFSPVATATATTRATDTPTTRPPTDTPTSRPPTDTPTPTARPATDTPTPRPTDTPTTRPPTNTPTASPTTERATETPTRRPTATPTSDRMTPTPTLRPSDTPTPRVTATPTVPREITPTIQVGDFAVNGNLRVSGYGFRMGTPLSALVTDGQTSVILGPVSINRSGELLPTDFPWQVGYFTGDYLLQIVDDIGTRIASDTFTVHPSPLVRTSPMTGPPGTMVDVFVEGVMASDLRIEYARGLVIGPARTEAGTYVGQFEVPRDRPVPLGQVTTVNARMYRGDQLLGEGSVPFTSEPPEQPPTFEIQNLRSSRDDLRPGTSFTLQGEIVPPPRNGSGRMQLTAVWEGADGVTSPLASSQAFIEEDGSFMVTAVSPDLLRGDPFTARNGDKYGVQFVTPDQTLLDLSLETIFTYNAFQIRLVKDMAGGEFDGEPIPNFPENAIQVWFEPRMTFQAPVEDLVIDLNKSTPLLDTAPLIGQQYQNNLQSAHNDLVDALNDCFIYAETAAIPFWEWVMNPAETVILSNLPAIDIENLDVQLQIPGGLLEIAQAPTEVTVQIFDVRIDASMVVDPEGGLAGYGEVNQDGHAINYLQRYAYIPELDLAFALPDELVQGDIIPSIPHPVTIALPPLPVDWLGYPIIQSILVGYGAALETGLGFGDNRLGTLRPGESLTGVDVQAAEDEVWIYGDFHSFVGLDPATIVDPPGGSLSVHAFPLLMAIDKADQAELLEAVILFQGQEYPMELVVEEEEQSVNATEICGLGLGGNAVEVSFVGYIPNAHLLPPGEHKATVQISGGNYATATQDILLIYRVNPNNDEEIKYLTDRKWSWGGGWITLNATALRPETAQSKLDGNSKMQEVAPKNYQNSLAVGSTVEWYKNRQSQWEQQPNEGTMQSTAVGNEADDLSFGPKSGAGNQTKGTLQRTRAESRRWLTSPNGTQYLPDVDQQVEILDTGWITIFKAAYGIPGIAEIGLGVNLKATAVAGIKTAPIEVTTFFDATIGIKVFADASILSGLAEASVDVSSDVGVLVPTTYELNGGKVDTGECFHYAAFLHYEIDVFWGVWRVAEGTEPLFNGKTGDCSFVMTALPDQSPSNPLPSLSPDVASDGFGHVMAVWQSRDGDIVASSYDGATWSAPQTIVDNRKSTNPAIAFYARNKAVAVWSQSGLTQQPPEDMTVAEFLRHQHLAFALYDGETGSWSNPQDLTTPTTGDGMVSLASCPDEILQCPEGGAVTAVWVHDAAGDITQRQFRIQAGVFQGSNWEVKDLDPASSGSDTEPGVAYADGIPVVVWVNDADASLLTTADRYLRVRELDGSADVVQPSDFPAGVVEPDMVVDETGGLHLVFTVVKEEGLILSNERPLYYATSACQDCASKQMFTSLLLAERTWTVDKVQDAFGRTLLAESPVITLDNQGQPTITYRAFGLDPLSPTGEKVLAVKEPLGVMAGTGELAQVDIVNGQATSPRYLTGDGAANWQTVATYDPELNRTVALAVKGQAVGANDNTRLSSAEEFNATEALTADDSLVFTSVGRGPNFTIRAVAVDRGYFSGDAPVTALVEVQNTGLGWTGAGEEGLQISATWDAADGQGEVAGTAVIPALAADEVTEVEISLTAPMESPEGEHILYITVNAGQAIPEGLATDNSASLAFGTLPRPKNLFALTAGASDVLAVYWTEVADDRVVGYKVYRAHESGTFLPVGSSPVAGWVDTNVEIGEDYQYTVTAMTADLLESAQSQVLIAGLPDPDPPPADWFLYTPLQLQ